MSALCRWFRWWCDCRRLPRRYGHERYCGRPCPRVTPYVVVQFTDQFLAASKIPYDDEVPGEQYLGRELWKQISRGDPHVKLRALYPVIRTARFKAYDAFVRERARRPLANLRGAFQITGPRGTDVARIAELLRGRPEVVREGTYVERPSLPPQVDPTGQPLVAQQRHLDPPFGGAQLGGINARGVWAQHGSDGAGVRFADVERGWDLGHPDLPPQRMPGVAIPLLNGINDSGFDDHGAGVLGIICATDSNGGTNTIGGIGITPRAEGFVSSWFMGYDDDWNEIANIPGAILAAATALFTLRQSTPAGVPAFGEVLLVEASVDKEIDGATLQVPAEANYGNWDQIDRARLAGMTVVEAGGNGDKASTSVDVDRPEVTGANPDSGAILVSAAEPLGGRFQRMPWAPRGNRVDCFAAGNGVTTCHSTAWGPPGNPYRHDYDGTSAATAIIAGAAICLQSLARVTPVGNPPTVRGLLTERQVRLALTDVRWSTAAMDPAAPHPEDPSIGRMPDLGALWQALLAGDLHAL